MEKGGQTVECLQYWVANPLAPVCIGHGDGHVRCPRAASILE